MRCPPLLVNERLLPTLSPIYPQIWEGVCIFGDSPVPHFENAKIWNPVMTGVCQVMTGVCQGVQRHGKNPNNEAGEQVSLEISRRCKIGGAKKPQFYPIKYKQILMIQKAVFSNRLFYSTAGA